MTLSTRPYKGSFLGLYESVEAALANLGEIRKLDDLSMVGPVPVYVLDPHEVSQDVLKVNAARPAYWRALMLTDKAPVACVDLPAGDSSRHSVVRGKDAAVALNAALDIARHAEHSSNRYDVRIVQLPRLFVTALWLESREPAFIPTREGGTGRPAARALRRQEFVELVRGCLARSTHASPKKPGSQTDINNSD